VVDALTRIHAALVPGGLLVDTQPVGLRLPVRLAGEALGALEAEEWLELVAAVDAEIEQVLADGLFELRTEARYPVVHEFGSGDECLEEVSSWVGTRLPAEVVARLEHAQDRATAEHEVRLRLFARR
jgi:hypothetical protein